MEYEDLRLIVRLAVEVRELRELLLPLDIVPLEKLDQIIKDARKLGSIHGHKDE